MHNTQSEKFNYLIFAFPLIILSVFMIGYWPVFQKLFIRWGGGDNSYCYLIVPLFAYLLWDRRAKRGERYAVKGKRLEVGGEGYADGGYRLEVGGEDRKQQPQTSNLKLQTTGDFASDLKPDTTEGVTPQTSNLRPQSTGGFRFGEFFWNVWGVVPVTLSICLIIIGELGSVETLMYTGIWGCAAGMFFVLYGRRIRYLIFPLLILSFIVPLPAFINRTLTFQLKLSASKLSTVMLRISGVSVLREGNIIDLGISQLQVVDACSGLRYLMPLFLMALLVGYFFNKRLWQRAILVLVVVPLSVFVNSMRIWVTGMLTVKGYEKLAQSFFHDFSGWLIFMIAGAILVVMALFLKRIGHRFTQTHTDQEKIISHRHTQTHTDVSSCGLAEGKGVIASRKSRSVDKSNDINDPNLSSEILLCKPRRGFHRDDPNQQWTRPVVLTIVLCLLFAGSGWAIKAIPSARNLPERMPFKSFPMQIGQWQGERHYISKEILDQLWSDDYVSATYTRPGSQNYISLLIPFYEYQGTRHTAHAPQACMLGGGWALFNSGERPVTINPNVQIKIMTMTWEKGNYKLLGSYFFLQRGRVITSPWMNKFYLMWDAFTKRRTDGALVRVELAVAPGQSIDDAYEVLEEFTAKLWPILPKYIPN